MFGTLLTGKFKTQLSQGVKAFTNQVVVHDAGCPYQYFKLIFDDDLIDHLQTETNCCASQYLASTNLLPNARVRKWKSVSKKELEVFLD